MQWCPLYKFKACLRMYTFTHARAHTHTHTHSHTSAMGHKKPRTLHLFYSHTPALAVFRSSRPRKLFTKKPEALRIQARAMVEFARRASADEAELFRAIIIIESSQNRGVIRILDQCSAMLNLRPIVGLIVAPSNVSVVRAPHLHCVASAAVFVEHFQPCITLASSGCGIGKPLCWRL